MAPVVRGQTPALRQDAHSGGRIIGGWGKGFEDEEDNKVDDDSIPPYFKNGIRGSALPRKYDHMEPVPYGSLHVELFSNVLDGLFYPRRSRH